MFGERLNLAIQIKDREIKGLHSAINELREQVAGLTKAYDALFDVVVQELGYAPEEMLGYVPVPGTYNFKVAMGPKTPRQFAKTSPAAEFVRVPKAKGK